MTPENTTQENTPDNKKDTSPLLEVRDLHTWFHTEEGVSRAVDGVIFPVANRRCEKQKGRVTRQTDVLTAAPGVTRAKSV